jgi:hypothetical protein
MKLDPVGSRREDVSRLVEPDVTVHPDPEDLQIDASRRVDGGLVTIALGIQIRGHAVEEVDRRRGHVQAAKEMLFHEAAKASRVVSRDAGKLVEIERPDAGEIDLAARVHPLQLAVRRDRTSSRRQPKHGVRFPAHDRRDVPGKGPRRPVWSWKDVNVHAPAQM